MKPLSIQRSKSMHIIARALQEGSDLKAPLIRALLDRGVAASIARLQERHAELARLSRFRILHDVVVRADSGEGQVLTLLREAEIEVASLIADARAAQRAFEEVLDVQRAKHKELSIRVSREILELPNEIAVLDTKIRRFDTAREQYFDGLREKGVDARTLAQLEPSPTTTDLEQWQSAVAEKRERLAHLQAFDKSGPFFDTRLLGDQILQSLSY